MSYTPEQSEARAQVLTPLLAACKPVLESFKTALFAGYEQSGYFASHAEIDALISSDKRVIALEAAIASAESEAA